MMTQTRNLVTTQDGEKIAVWKIVDSKIASTVTDTLTTNTSVIKPQNIFLTHGTFSDKQTCLKIAEYLASLGHHCYIMEWRGHGDSSMPKEKFNFETVATYDYEATFRYFFEELKLDNLHCVTHSGGGIGLIMFLIQNPCYINKTNSISMFACQAYGAASKRLNHTKIIAAKILTRLLGRIPARKLKMGACDESDYTMRQWYDWNLQQNFNSIFIKKSTFNQPNSGTSDGDEPLDYRQQMPNITIPVYAISAKGDNFIAPTYGCRQLFDDFKNPDNVFREYSRSNGDFDDYTHSRIMISRNAAKEIWPTVTAWIEKYST
ncbi:MAG: alpha/beta fold hydrolase [Psychrobacter sp.]|uniref:alpha/beta fold hydrolase n=1 Tax=Psychrobacter sp. AOP7-B1-24 TaxID=3457645 RepID=UPI003FB98A82